MKFAVDSDEVKATDQIVVEQVSDAGSTKVVINAQFPGSKII